MIRYGENGTQGFKRSVADADAAYQEGMQDAYTHIYRHIAGYFKATGYFPRSEDIENMCREGAEYRLQLMQEALENVENSYEIDEEPIINWFDEDIEEQDLIDHAQH